MQKNEFSFFQLMNLEDSQVESQNGSFWNIQEARAVAKLAKAVKKELEENVSIGILTFYNSQRAKIRQCLKDLKIQTFDERQQSAGMDNKNAVSIRSVDGFQVKKFPF